MALAANAALVGCSPALVRVAPAAAQSASSPYRVLLTRSDFQITYVLQGQTQAGLAVWLLSDPQLSLVPAVPPGSGVPAGTPVGRTVVAASVRGALQAGVAVSSLDRGELAQLRSLEGPVRAPVSGVFAIAGGQPVLRDPGIDVVVGLLPIQYLRYSAITFSGEATVETLVGQRQVPCAAVWVQPGGQAAASSGTPYELHCRLPGYVQTAAGLTAQLILRSARYRDVVVVPDIDVSYDQATDGYFIDVVENGRTHRLPVTVGMTNGVVRVVTSPVPLGAVVVSPAGG
jgi:hypothetical protein